MRSTETNPSIRDEVLSSWQDDQRAALERRQKTIRFVALRAEEWISCKLAAFRLNRRPLTAFGATETHRAFDPMSSDIDPGFGREIEGCGTGEGAIRLQPGRPPRVALARKLVKARMAENDERTKTK